MSDRFPGGVISKTPPTVVGPVDDEGGSASGVWKLDEQLGLQKAGAWPKRVFPRELYGWGTNTSRELGDGTGINRSSPVQIGALTNWSKIAAGANHSLAIKNDRTLWAWGAGGQGRLGTNSSPAYISSPVQVGALTNWSEVGAGNISSAAITIDGELYVWGNNGSGALGDNTTIDKSSPTLVGALTNWSFVSVSDASCAALKTDGTLWCWGRNDEGQLGQGDRIFRSSPVQVGTLTDWTQIATGYRSVIAVKSNGTLWSFGSNSGAREGQLGDGTIISRSSPVQVGSLTSWARPAGGSGFSAAVKTNGTLWVWGKGGAGQIGDGSRTDKSSPVQIGALTNWLNISCGANFCAAVKTDGTLFTWGGGYSGQLGINAASFAGYRSSPVQVGGTVGWSTVSAGSPSGTFSLGIIKGL